MKTALVHVKTLPAGQDVGYGANLIRRQLMKVIGTIPIWLCGWLDQRFTRFPCYCGWTAFVLLLGDMDQIAVRLPKVYP